MYGLAEAVEQQSDEHVDGEDEYVEAVYDAAVDGGVVEEADAAEGMAVADDDLNEDAAEADGGATASPEPHSAVEEAQEAATGSRVFCPHCASEIGEASGLKSMRKLRWEHCRFFDELRGFDCNFCNLCKGLAKESPVILLQNAARIGRPR